MTCFYEDTNRLVCLRHPEWAIDSVIGRTLYPSEAIVVTGFWRSGTTWLLQSIARARNAKPILEPLYSEFAPYRTSVLSSTYGLDLRRSFRIPLMPYADKHFEKGSPLRAYIRRALVSSISGVYPRTPRYDAENKLGINGTWGKIAHRLREAMRTRVAVKFTRAHFLIPAIRNEFGPTILHIRRDPRAVVASILRTNWQWPADLSLVEQLLEVGDGREQLFREDADALRKLNRRGIAARLTGYWVCVERYVRQLEDEGMVIPVRYERLVRHGADYLARVLPEETETTKDFLAEESASTQSERKDVSREKRLYGWKNELSSRNIEQVNRALDVLGSDFHDEYGM
ncbi:hypothetical protein BSZ35_11130 [Salinibacter sp. 10B]|uniref:sulfotransferase n=1 Tax=Salinibacter sp. 10B TaxID=1923971 RepID=UPI000D2BD8D4|nr:sulfotransferase [Salinibacter sp. 10B]PQJ35074.1 hypothetical protein BSZ35_11130 [Salinibacter sp. 10B]